MVTPSPAQTVVSPLTVATGAGVQTNVKALESAVLCASGLVTTTLAAA
jgi:hypothetical protein